MPLFFFTNPYLKVQCHGQVAFTGVSCWDRSASSSVEDSIEINLQPRENDYQTVQSCLNPTYWEPSTFLRYTVAVLQNRPVSSNLAFFEPPTLFANWIHRSDIVLFGSHSITSNPWKTTHSPGTLTYGLRVDANLRPPPLSQERHGLVMVKSEQMQNDMSLEGIELTQMGI